MTEHYFDNAATTKVCEEAVAAAVNAMRLVYGNPSSTHTKGREAKALLDECRKAVALTVGAAAEEIYFTSCGTESDNWAILCGARANKRVGRRIITSAVEHDAVRKSMALLKNEGFEIAELTADSTGRILPESVEHALTPDTCLVSLMRVNNETGAVTDIPAIADVLRRHDSKAYFHTDAVQGYKKVDCSVKRLGVDMMSLSGHKIHAPKGIGALYIRKGIQLPPMLVGGLQQDGLRAGTEALPQIAAFAAAAKRETDVEKIAAQKAYIVKTLTDRLPQMRVIPTEAPHIVNISLPGYKSEVLMNFLEARGVYVSKSSACKRGKRSHVLEAIGLDGKSIDGSLRIGLSCFTTDDDVEALIAGIADSASLMHR